MPSINKSYRVLGLHPSSSQEEIKKAYRDLAQVWHPDRFAHNPRLQKKAQDNLKRINEAYETLRSYDPPTTNDPSTKLGESFSAIIGIGDMLKTGQFKFRQRPRRSNQRRRVVVPDELDPTGVHRLRRGTPRRYLAWAGILMLVIAAIFAATLLAL